MFELIFNSTGFGAKFLRDEGKIEFVMETPLYFPSGQWNVAVSKYISNKPTEETSFIESNLVGSKFLNGRSHSILYVCSGTSQEDNPVILSFCEVALLELSKLVLHFKTANNIPVSIADDFDFTIILVFKQE